MAGMILTIGNTKGGTGKTTLAVQLAITFARDGRDVLLVDGDVQASSQTSIAIRAEAGRRPALACVHYTEGRVLRDQVNHQRAKYDHVLIDAGGRDSGALRAALLISDVLLVPFMPRSVDVWALADIAKLVEEARTVRDGLQALAVLNGADPGGGSDNTDAQAALADFPGLRLVDAPIRRRKAFANATGQGLSVDELTPLDAKASAELATLYSKVKSLADAPVINGG
jgi:chromosome partitioning protein